MTPSALPTPLPRRARRRTALWVLLVLLLVVAQSLLVALTVRYESSRSQDDIDALAAEASVQLRRELQRGTQELQALSWARVEGGQWTREAQTLMQRLPELLRVERRDLSLVVRTFVDNPTGGPLFTQIARTDLSVDTELACLAAQRQAAPLFSRSYFVPLPDGRGVEVLDLCLPVVRAGEPDGYVVGTIGLPQVLDGLLSPRDMHRVELSVLESDGARLARAGGHRGAGIFIAERVVDLPGIPLRLRLDSGAGEPSLVPTLTLALVMGLSLALFAVVLVLARDTRRRAEAERALAETLAVRKAMEDSLITGLRARNLDGELIDANPAFCAMVGYSPDEMRSPEPPYWPPEQMALYRERQRARRYDTGARDSQREGFETVFMRKSGERFPVMIYEAPLLDAQGHHTGWMSTVVDVSAQRRVEELSRQQQDRLQASARLATVGEMASLMSHELNQPLAAIASYASGSINLIDDATAAGAGTDGDDRTLVRQALERIAEQAERAGRIIKSVHRFVRRREPVHEAISVDQLIDGVLPLVRLQARKSGTRIELDLPDRPPRVQCDRTMVEQVLLNLSRNAIQAMEGDDTPLDSRVLTLRVRQQHPQWVTFHVIDRGPGIAADVAPQMFTPFFTTRSEGMGLGLSLCRTVIEQHGGALDFGPAPGGAPGTEFRFTLPAPRQAESRDAAVA